MALPPQPGVVSVIINNKVLSDGDAFDFGSVTLPSAALSHTATIWNNTTGYVTVTGNGISTAPADAGFSVTAQSATSVSIAKRKSQTFMVKFPPATSGSMTGTLNIAMAGIPFAIDLTGTAQA
jgi:hypothetical protein